jgi:hypothetical protein
VKTFNIGDRVRIQEEALGLFRKALAKRLRGRVASIIEQASWSEDAFRLKFPKDGRKTEFVSGFIFAGDLEPADGDRDG